jgi:ABC-type transport system involved in multi-copper enzyme maturation permease subunit
MQWMLLSLLFWILLSELIVFSLFLIVPSNVYLATFLREFISAVSIFCLWLSLSVREPELNVNFGVTVVL